MATRCWLKQFQLNWKDHEKDSEIHFSSLTAKTSLEKFFYSDCKNFIRNILARWLY